MKNILDKLEKEKVLERINNLTETDKALWGKMTPAENICHMTDQIKLATGKINCGEAGNKIAAFVLRNLILMGLPAPKGKVETYPRLKQGAGGTAPTEFAQDKKTLTDVINNYENDFPGENKILHPAFGFMNKAEWARLVYLHLDHHLRQFGK